MSDRQVKGVAEPGYKERLARLRGELLLLVEEWLDAGDHRGYHKAVRRIVEADAPITDEEKP